jgi:glucose/arabinose dehydrogenase
VRTSRGGKRNPARTQARNLLAPRPVADAPIQTTFPPMKRSVRTLSLFAVAWLALAAAPHLAPAQLTRQANTTLNLPVNLPSATGWNTENALGTLNFNHPICITSVPGETHRLFIVERGGTMQVVSLTANPPTKSLYFSLTPLLGTNESLTSDSECGFLSAAFHPNFATNGRLFVFYSLRFNNGTENQLFQRVAEIVVSNPSVSNPTVTLHRPLITQRDQASNHNGGDMHFGADGYLYISTGDEGGANDQFNKARFINKDFFGAILRIDVDNRSGNLTPNSHSQASVRFPSAVHSGTYRVPADNPFIGRTSWHNQSISASSVRTEIWATGLRNPWRMAFDRLTGRLFVADVGQNAREEINIVTAGGDYGWSWREGLIPFTSGPDPKTPPATGFNPIDPIHDYPRSDGFSITGGEVYRGTRLTELFGAYIFADYGSGNVWALRETAGVWTRQLLRNVGGLVEFGVDPRNGDVLFCSLGTTSIIQRLTRSGSSGTAPPASLSATGAFSSLANLTPHQGIVAYEPNVSFWSDYATKRRWFSIKNLTDTIGYHPVNNWQFPTGMVWIKHFDIETERGNPATRRKLETRFLVKTTSEVYGLSYRWRADQTDADLVAEEGLTETIPNSNPSQLWRFPSRNECKICHTPAGGFALSFNAAQIHRSFTYGAVSQNQLSALSGAGYFSSPVSNPNAVRALAKADDSSQSLEWRVRSYLAANCVQCHQPGGGATGNWDARQHTPTDLAGIINGLLINSGGDPAARFVVPGNLTHSMLLRRLRGDGVPRMPPLATSERDIAAEQLISDWITQTLPSRQSFSQWQITHFGSTSVPAAQPQADPDFDGDANATEFLRGTLPTVPTGPLSSTIVLQTSGNQFTLQFQQPANRAALIETTTNFQTWSLWNVPGNTPTYPATNTQRTLSGPIDTANRFFRLNLSEP